MLSSAKKAIWKFRGIALPSSERCDDLYIVEFPKSGITWFSNVIAHLIARSGGRAIPDAIFVNDYVHDVHMSRHLPASVAHPWPGHRVLKSHSRGNPYYLKVIYLVRHPVAVMSSYFDYARGLGYFSGDFSTFVRSQEFGAHAWNNHVKSWVDVTRDYQRISLLRYEDLVSDTLVAVDGALTGAGLTMDRETLQWAVECSSFDAMKKREGLARSRDMRQKFERFGGFHFVNKGRNADGAVQNAVDIEYIWSVCGEAAGKLGYAKPGERKP